MNQPSPPSNPLDALGPAWTRYKRAHVSVQKELAIAHASPEYNIQALRWGNARTWHAEAVVKWTEACELVLGRRVQIEWVGDTGKPMCIVNGALMFA